MHFMNKRLSSWICSRAWHNSLSVPVFRNLKNTCLLFYDRQRKDQKRKRSHSRRVIYLHKWPGDVQVAEGQFVIIGINGLGKFLLLLFLHLSRKHGWYVRTAALSYTYTSVWHTFCESPSATSAYQHHMPLDSHHQLHLHLSTTSL